MENIKNFDIGSYFHLLGWQDDELMGIGYNCKNESFYRWVIRVGELIEGIQNSPFQRDDGENAHYSIATFKNKENQRQSNVDKVKELVFDIDFGIDGHHQSQFKTREEAEAYIQQLPKPTVTIMSGGGFQLHYRLDGGAEKGEFMRVTQMLSQYLNIDSCSSCEHLFRMPFSFNSKVLTNIRAVEIVDVNDVGYTLEDFKKLIPNGFKFSVPTEKEYQKQVIHRTIRESKISGVDRSIIAFSTIARIISEFPSISDTTLVTAIKRDEDIYSHYHSEKELRKDICRIRNKVRIGSIQPILPVEHIESSDVDISALEPIRTIFDKKQFPSRIPKMETTLKILSKLINERKSGILNVPCSSGKTFSAIIHLAYLASQGKRAWLVSEKIEDCKHNAEILRSLGVNAVALHGRDTVMCTVSDKHFLSDIEGCCRRCTNRCGAELKYIQHYQYDYPQANIVCVTHKHYKSALFAQAIPSDVSVIIIDEAPNLLENFSCTENDLKPLLDVFRGDEELGLLFEENWCNRVIELLQDRGSHFIGDIGINQFKNKIRRYLWACRNNNSISIETQEFINQFVGFFSNKNVWGMRNGDEYCFMCGELNIETDIPTIILDGSARNQIVKWNGFSIFESDELKTEYPNTHIYCIPCNPTQSKLSNKEIFSEITKWAEMNIKEAERVLIFSNKDLSNKAKIMENIDDLRNILADRSCIIKDLPRGKHIGSNEGMKCSSSLIAMSLFSTVADYVLRASIYHNREFLQPEIFNKYGESYSPKFKVNGDFIAEDVNEIYHRTLERDLYQAILRGCIRSDSSAEYKAIALVASPIVVQTLQEDMPKANITMIGMDIPNLYFDGYSESEIAEKLNISKQLVHYTIQRLGR